MNRVLEHLMKLVPLVSFGPPPSEDVLNSNSTIVPEDKGPLVQGVEEMPGAFLESINEEDARLRTHSAEVTDNSRGREDILKQVLSGDIRSSQ
ncbi:hypothetical protein ACOSP7_026733 [Xanthoceras sorbifolium]